MNAMGCPFCCKTAPIPVPEALVSMWKGKLKSGNANTGAEQRAYFRTKKADSWVEV